MMLKLNVLCLLSASLLIAACGADDGAVENSNGADGIDDCFTCVDARADHLTMSSYERAGVLDLVNTASRHVLDDEVGLDGRAANNIVDARVAGGAFTSLELLDAVSYVGPSALERLRSYASDHGWVGACGDARLQGRVESCDDGNKSSGDGCSASCQVEAGVKVHGFSEGSLEALEILEVANTATFDELDVAARLDSRAAQGIIDGRPFGSLTQLDAVSYVGAGAFTSMLDFASTRDRCDEGTIDQLIVDVNGTSWSVESTREIRTDRSLAWATDSRNWPSNLTHAGCFGVRPAGLPASTPVTAAEDSTRVRALLKSFAEAAERRGMSVELDTALDELECRTAGVEFVGCRFEFEPSVHSGTTWNIVSATDGSLELLFVGTWRE